MLDTQIVSETEKLEATAEKVDDAFRVSQREWLEMKARTVTLSRLILERYPKGVPANEGMRRAAEQLLSLHENP